MPRLQLVLLVFSACTAAVVRAQYDQPAPEEPNAPASKPHRDEEKTTKSDEPIPPPSPKKVCGISDILFVLDSTGSVHGFYEDQKTYMVSLIEGLDVGPDSQHVGIIKYSSHRRMKVMVGLDEGIDKALVVGKVRDLSFNGGITETGAALGLVKTALEKRRPDKKTAVVVLTDGFSFDKVPEPAKEIQNIPNVVVFVAGLADPALHEVLVDIAGDESRVILGEAGKATLLQAMSC